MPKKKQIAPTEKTTRGFMLGKFLDHNGIKCSIQQSSAIGDTKDAWDRPGSSMLWLGVEDVKPQILSYDLDKLQGRQPVPNGWVPYPVPKEVMFHDRMHLSRDQVLMLINTLQHWADTGELPG